MSLKQFQILKIVSAMIIAGLVSYSIVIENYLIPIICVATAWVVLFWARSKVTDIVADERDYEVGGHAARWSIMIFSWISVIAMFVLLYEKALNPVFEVVAYVLAYSVCGLMLLYSLLFNYYGRISLIRHKNLYVIVGIILLAIFVVAGLRLFTGEDGWICDNGQWVEHGHPETPMPTTICQK